MIFRMTELYWIFPKQNLPQTQSLWEVILDFVYPG